MKSTKPTSGFTFKCFKGNGESSVLIYGIISELSLSFDHSSCPVLLCHKYGEKHATETLGSYTQLNDIVDRWREREWEKPF